MANYLWKVTAKRDNGTVKKGMSAEILTKNFTGKPNATQIAEALSEKYGEIKSSAVNVHFFKIKKLS